MEGREGRGQLVRPFPLDHRRRTESTAHPRVDSWNCIDLKNSPRTSILSHPLPFNLNLTLCFLPPPPPPPDPFLNPPPTPLPLDSFPLSSPFLLDLPPPLAEGFRGRGPGAREDSRSPLPELEGTRRTCPPLGVLGRLLVLLLGLRGVEGEWETSMSGRTAERSRMGVAEEEEEEVMVWRRGGRKERPGFGFDRAGGRETRYFFLPFLR